MPSSAPKLRFSVSDLLALATVFALAVSLDIYAQQKHRLTIDIFRIFFFPGLISVLSWTITNGSANHGYLTIGLATAAGIVSFAGIMMPAIFLSNWGTDVI